MVTVPMRLILPITVLALAGGSACARSRPVARQQSSAPLTRDPPSDVERRAANAVAPADAAEKTRHEGTGAEYDWDALQAPVYFDFDRSDLTANARGALAAKLLLLHANPHVRIELVGHADERGSDEYNLALRLQRAVAAKRYLTERGVTGDRIAIMSAGEERPACREHSESCRWRNRRDEFRITGRRPPARQ